MALSIDDFKKALSEPTFKPVDLNNVQYKFNVNHNLKNCVAREPSMMDKFYCFSSTDNDGEKSLHLGDDLHLLLNRKFMSHVNPSTIADWVSTLRPTVSSSLNSSLSKLTDEQLSSFVKSRHIQAPCELLAWSNYLQDMTDKVESEVKNTYNEAMEAVKELQASDDESKVVASPASASVVSSSNPSE